MQTCENCGKSFEKSADRMVEVTTVRVLCPACSAARAAAKARQASAAGARPASDGKPASAPTSSVPARKVQPRPGPATNSASTPAPAPAPARPRPAASPAPAAPVAARPARPATPAARPAATKPAEKKHKIDVEHLASHNLQKKGSREVWIAFGVAVVVLAVAGGVFWMVKGKHAADKAASDAVQAAIDGFTNEFRSIDIAVEAGANRLIAFADENKHIWEPHDELAGEVINRTAKARDFLERLDAIKELLQRLDAIEQVMARAAELPPSELAEQLRRMAEIKPKAGIVGPEFEARLDKDLADGERVHMERLVAAAETAAATEPLDRAALTTLGTVEDDVHRIFENVYRAWDKNRQDVALADKKKDYEEKYRRVISLSDAAVERFYTVVDESGLRSYATPAVESIPWRDLLADASAWKTSEIKGFEHVIKDGVLHLVGPEASADGQGVMSIGDKEIWRDFLLDMEITVLQGECELFFRLSPVWQKNVESLPLTTDEGYLEAGRTYNYAYTVVGSTLIEEQIGEGPQPKTISWTQIRKGAFGIAVPKETEIKITRLRARILR